MISKKMPAAAAVVAVVCASARNGVGASSAAARTRSTLAFGNMLEGMRCRAFDPIHRRSSWTTSRKRNFPTNAKAPPSRSRCAVAGAPLASTAMERPSAPTREKGGDAVASSSLPTLFKVNLHTLPLPDLELLLASWGYPAFRARQIHRWIRDTGASSFDEMANLPRKLRDQLEERAVIGALELAAEQTSNDGTIKRAYRLHDGQVVESVLMPYDDGRNTACVSSQAGCAMGCVFCATGQMGFARQLTADEIFEQVARFASELRADDRRLSNVVMMGMGEPLANYRNVLGAVHRMNEELGISARRITISTVGVVPSIRKLMNEDLQVRLAVSLHCASDEERTALIPANRRYGGLDELMRTIREYIDVTRRRVTFEWALIEGQNDTPDVARQLGKLLKRHGVRSDMAHVNLIPLNPTGGFGGGPSGRASVSKFVSVLEDEFRISATPRMRRGIDIDAGCGQLKSAVEKKKGRKESNESDGKKAVDDMLGANSLTSAPQVGVYEDEQEEDKETDAFLSEEDSGVQDLSNGSMVEFAIIDEAVNLDNEFDAEEFVDPTYEDEFDLTEAERLVSLVKGSSLVPPVEPTVATTEQSTSTDEIRNASKSTTITDEVSVKEAKRRRKKLLKNLKAVQKLRDMEASGKVLNEEQLAKVMKKEDWIDELESVEHNLK